MKETNRIIRNHLAEEKYKTILFSWLSQMQEADHRNEFSGLNLPMHIILGKNDSLINSEIESDIKELNPNITSTVINNCGHAPFISKKEETVKIINEFVNARFN